MKGLGNASPLRPRRPNLRRHLKALALTSTLLIPIARGADEVTFADADAARIFPAEPSDRPNNCGTNAQFKGRGKINGLDASVLLLWYKNPGSLRFLVENLMNDTWTRNPEDLGEPVHAVRYDPSSDERRLMRSWIVYRNHFAARVQLSGKVASHADLAHKFDTILQRYRQQIPKNPNCDGGFYYEDLIHSKERTAPIQPDTVAGKHTTKILIRCPVNALVIDEQSGKRLGSTDGSRGFREIEGAFTRSRPR